MSIPMTTTHAVDTLLKRPRRHPGHRSRRVLLLPLAILLMLVLAAAAFIAYVLWPRWPEPAISPDAPSLPITVANVAFNVPPAALRMPVQRRPGSHERVDLAFLWPSLEPPDQAQKFTAPVAGVPTGLIERVFVTIAAAGDTLPPTERLKTIYPRYASTAPVAGPAGLAVLAFREGTPYQGEDLIYDAQTPDNFLVRCSRNGAGPTPGTCLFERRIETADVVVRFPRDWLGDWQDVAGNIDRLIKSLRPSGS
jgi:hypothetical protein